MGRNEWRDESDWPLPDTQYTNYYLHGGQSGSVKSLNDGTLSPNPPEGSENPDSFVYDPLQPVPTQGGNTLNVPGGVYDQREVEQLCLTFTSEPLTEEFEVTGPVRAVIYGLSSAPDTDWWYDSPMCTRTVTRGYYATASCGHDTGILSSTLYRWKLARYTDMRLICGGRATFSYRGIGFACRSRVVVSLGLTAISTPVDLFTTRLLDRLLSTRLCTMNCGPPTSCCL